MNAISNDRVRLMQFTTMFEIGGTERQLIELANGLDEERFALQLSCMHRRGPLLEKLKRPHNPEEFKIRRLYGFATMRQQLRFTGHLRKHRTQDFHAQGFYPNVFGIPAARLARTPVVIGSIRDLGDRRTRLQGLAQRLSCMLADAVVVNAEVVRRQLVGEGWPSKKIHVIHNGVDLSRFNLVERNAEARRQLGLPVEGQLVVTVSRLYPAKGIEQFIDAAPRIAARFPDARFVIIGDAAPGEEGTRYRAELEERAKKQRMGDRLVFTGFRLDVPELLKQADVAVIPSLSEATSNSLLESMASGAAVVATDAGGNPDIVAEGKTGLLIPPSDPERLTEAVCTLLGDPDQRARLGEAGRAFVHERFSLQQMVRNTEQLYLDLLERSTRGQTSRLGGQHEHAFPS
jgi:glycosyltransferase involved in cell wall biosynthesis